MSSVFKTPIMYATWGLRNGGDAWSDVHGLRDHCLAHGFTSVAVEWGTNPDGQPTTTPDDVKVLSDAGLDVIAWNIADGSVGAVLNALESTGGKIAGVHFQVEGPSQYDGALEGFQAIRAWPIKKAIVTTYWGLLTNDNLTSVLDRYAKLKALGCSEAWIEVYANDGHTDALGMIQHGVDIGMPRNDLKPLLGTYRGELPPTYGNLSTFGRDFGCYIAEPMSEAQFEAWGGVNKVTQVYYWQVVTPGGAVLHEEKAITYADGSNGLGKTLDWLAANKPTIRITNDVEVKRVVKAV